MMMQSMCKKVVCFDLDDTLYKEIDYVQSAFNEIAAFVGHSELLSKMLQWYNEGNNVFQELNNYLNKETPVISYLEIYRNHYPTISLSEGVEEVLNELMSRVFILGLVTDGRSRTQRNKIKALGLERWFESSYIIISEEFGTDKSDEKNFRYFMDLCAKASFVYVGDNPKKDFVVPNQLHWKTIMLKDNGRNIHHQMEVPEDYFPQIVISNIRELLNIL